MARGAAPWTWQNLALQEKKTQEEATLVGFLLSFPVGWNFDVDTLAQWFRRRRRRRRSLLLWEGMVMWWIGLVVLREAEAVVFRYCTARMGWKAPSQQKGSREKLMTHHGLIKKTICQQKNHIKFIDCVLWKWKNFNGFWPVPFLQALQFWVC